MQLNRSSEESTPSKLTTTGEDIFSEKDEQLVWERFIKGDDQSLVYIYRAYADVLFRYGRQFTKRYEFLRDSIQELFYELMDKRSKLSAAKSVKAYLFTAFKRKIVRDLKKEEKFNLEQEGFLFSLADTNLSIANNLEEKDFTLIQQKLNLLPVNQREIILLHFYEGLTYAEIADIMNIKVRSARALTYRALDSLHKELTPLKGSLYLFLIQFIIR
ncbi:MAG: sigma-70 family RNA polymerase sigma factor [Cyclobacteriaceae bacterium]